MKTFHVVPINDLNEHTIDGVGACSCAPIMDRKNFFIHNSFDQREHDEKIGIIHFKKPWTVLEFNTPSDPISFPIIEDKKESLLIRALKRAQLNFKLDFLKPKK